MLGLCLGITILLGINIFVWLIVLLILLLITVNLDNTHISFSKKIMNNVTQEKREQLYKIERINISKLLISILIIFIFICIFYLVSRFLAAKYLDFTNNEFIANIVNNIKANNITNMHIDIGSIKERLSIFSSYSTTYYLILYVYILFAEVLAFILKRKYDTKSTTIKAIFLLTLLMVIITNVNLIVYQSMFTIMLILIAIVNTSNIYLNREERIKMLVA